MPFVKSIFAVFLVFLGKNKNLKGKLAVFSMIMCIFVVSLPTSCHYAGSTCMLPKDGGQLTAVSKHGWGTT